ncbi:MAG: hypothetical protein WCW44_06490 [archaeon]|jgi:hypothetical protein
MQKQILTLLALILLFICFVHALDYKPTTHSITIQISTEGNDKVIEKYYISFPTDADKLAFREKSVELGTSLDAWKQFNSNFSPSLGENTLNKKISYNEGEQNYLQISYDLSEPLMAKLKESTMATEYTIKVNYFDSFYHSGQWIIPEKTSISIELPPGAEIRSSTGFQTTTSKNVSRQVITWNGYQTTNELVMSYIVWKTMDPVIDLNAITNFLFKTQEGIILLLISAIIIIVLVMNRKKIYDSIEGFVEANSTIKEE